MRVYEDFISIADELVNGANIMSDCERFGMSNGCRPDCPIYQLGKCEVQEENRIFFEKEYGD